MRIEFDQARNALAFLQYHQLEPSAVNYQTALVHLSGSYQPLYDDVVSSIDAALLTDMRLAELATLHASGIAAWARHGRIEPADPAMAERLTATEQGLAELREQMAMLVARVETGRGLAVDAEHDELTNALNQVGARRVLDQIAAQDQRYVLLMFGIDKLVGINRQYGNSVGDNILNAFASKLANTFPEHEAIRWAGNEFIVAIPGQTMTAVREQAEEALQLLERRKFKLRDSGEAIGTVTASVALVSDQGNDIEWVIEEARAKLQGAMLSGGNRVAM
ncbi:MAG: GGDEF domain-containing protein [Sphingomonas paucimobilis]